MGTFKISSSDAVVFVENLSIARFSGTIKNTLDNISGPPEVIALTNVNSVVLKLALSWMKYHDQNPIPDAGDKDKEKCEKAISEWEGNFLAGLDDATLFELITAADYLKIACLLKATGKAISKRIVGKTPEQIRQEFGIKADITPDEQIRIEAENEWCRRH